MTKYYDGYEDIEDAFDDWVRNEDNVDLVIDYWNEFCDDLCWGNRIRQNLPDEVFDGWTPTEILENAEFAVYEASDEWVIRNDDGSYDSFDSDEISYKIDSDELFGWLKEKGRLESLFEITEDEEDEEDEEE